MTTSWIKQGGYDTERLLHDGIKTDVFVAKDQRGWWYASNGGFVNATRHPTIEEAKAVAVAIYLLTKE